MDLVINKFRAVQYSHKWPPQIITERIDQYTYPQI